MEAWTVGQFKWSPRWYSPSVLGGFPSRDLAEVWAKHGKETMIKTATDQPGVFFATCARLLPADVKLTIEQSYAGLSPEDYVLLKEVIAAVRQAIPNADLRPPGAVLEHVLSVLRQAEVKVIE